MSWNQQTIRETDAPTKQNARRTRKKYVAVVSGIVVAIATSIFCYIWGHGDSQNIPIANPLHKDIAPIANSHERVSDLLWHNRQELITISNSARQVWLGCEVLNHKVTTNGTLIIETYLTADGKCHKYYHDSTAKVLPTASDQILAMMTSENDGFGAPPLPVVNNFGEEFVSTLKKEIVVNKDDPEDIKEIKKRVMAARKELLSLVNQGVDPKEIVDDYQHMQEQNSTIRLEAAKIVREMLDEDDIEGAVALCGRYNTMLAELGLMPLEIPEEYLTKPIKGE